MVSLATEKAPSKDAGASLSEDRSGKAALSIEHEMAQANGEEPHLSPSREGPSAMFASDSTYSNQTRTLQEAAIN